MPFVEHQGVVLPASLLLLLDVRCASTAELPLLSHVLDGLRNRTSPLSHSLDQYRADLEELLPVLFET
jgi:hypothetical protein